MRKRTRQRPPAISRNTIRLARAWGHYDRREYHEVIRLLDSVVGRSESPDHPEHYNLLGHAYAALGQHRTAAKCYELVAGITNQAGAHLNAAQSWSDAGDPEAGAAWAVAALALDQNLIGGWALLADACRRIGTSERLATASDCERAAMALPANSPEERYAQAILRLYAGDWSRQTWELMEARWDIRAMAPPALPLPRWQGEPDAHVYVTMEQGDGDAMMFARWVPDVIATGARVTLQLPPRMGNVFRSNPNWRKEGESTGDLPVSLTVPDDATHAISFPSLPSVVGDVGGRVPPSEIASRSPTPTGPVCIRTVSNPSFRRAASRDVPEALVPVLIDRLRSAGYVVVHAEVEGASRMPADVPCITGATWGDTLDNLAQCRAVLTVDTSLAHLAGGAGLPTVTMLGSPVDWRWTHDGGDRTDWYDTMRLIRPTAPGEWGRVIVDAVEAVRDV